jgi:hypothetical protein
LCASFREVNRGKTVGNPSPLDVPEFEYFLIFIFLVQLDVEDGSVAVSVSHSRLLYRSKGLSLRRDDCNRILGSAVRMLLLVSTVGSLNFTFRPSTNVVLIVDHPASRSDY